MKNSLREESGGKDDEKGNATILSGYSSSCRSFELARCTSEGLLMRKVDFESDSWHLRVIAKFKGRISFGGRFHVFDCRIPRHAVGLHEQYLRHYLEWVLGKASKVMPFNLPLALTASTIDGNSKLRRRLAVKRTSRRERVNSSADLTAATDMKLISWINKHRLQSLHLQSMDMKSADWAGVSSSSSSARSSNYATSGSVSHGMLVFRWIDGMPRFVFSPDEQGEVYVADLTRVTSSDRINPDYKYLIHMNEHGTKERSFDKVCDYHVGEINMAASNSVYSNVSKIRTTEFVLFGGYKIPVKEERGDRTGKNKGLPRKAVKAFSFKSRRSSKSTLCQSGISKDFSAESRQDKVTVLENYRHPRNELAAIVVKGCMKDTATEQKQEAGGWGLKFLRKIEAAGIKECSERMNVIIPAGVHGGPRTASGGASSLIKRWKSGGKCDCGGWDLGCPLTLLEARLPEPAGNLQLVDHVVGGSITALRMTTVRDGLFLIRFDSSLSALQALSVAVAYVHTHSPLLQQRLGRSQFEGR